MALAGDVPEARAVGERLMAAWREPHRRYHTVDHLQAVLDRLDELDPDGTDMPALGPAGLTASGAARMAAWYHDAVYRPGATDNEAASAAMAESDLRALGWRGDDAAEVARLVLVTVEHRSDPQDEAAALLCDADLAVLGADPSGYARYVAAVRAEYAAVDDDGWRRGRSAVLAALLGADRLFVTPAGLARWDEPARRNLGVELDILTRG